MLTALLKNLRGKSNLSRAPRRTSSKRKNRLGSHLRCENLEDRRMLATLTVNSLSDIVDSNGDPIDDGIMTLRDAVAYVNGPISGATPDFFDQTQIDDLGGSEPLGTNDKIIFDPILFALDTTDGIYKAEIELLHKFNNLSALQISSRDIVIEANYGYELEISVADSLDARVFEITANSGSDHDITLKNLAFTGGYYAGSNNRGHEDFSGGAGVFLGGNLSVLIDTVRFEDNYAEYGSGGGLHVITDSLLITNSEFISNTSEYGEGGGLFLKANNGDYHEVVNSYFTNNEAMYGGGLAVRSETGSNLDRGNGQALLENLLIENNTTMRDGGGVFLTSYEAGGGVNDPGLIILRDSVVRHNTAGNGITAADGGGIYVRARYQRILLDSLSVTNNQTVQPPIVLLSALVSSGGGIYVHSGIYPIDEEYAVEIVNSTIAKNESTAGGGVYVGSVLGVGIRHSTITENSVSNGPGNAYGNSNGGGISVGSSFNNGDIGNGPASTFLDHVIVINNYHVGNNVIPPEDPNNPYTDLQLSLYALYNMVNESPDIGLENRYDNDDYNYTINFSTGLYEKDPMPIYETVINKTYVGVMSDAVDGYAPFVGTQVGSGSLIEDTYGSYSAVIYQPSGGFVDVGDYTGSNPDYALAKIPDLLGTNEIAFDQRDAPYSRIYNGIIDIGAIEVQPDPAALPQVQAVEIKGSTSTHADYLFENGVNVGSGEQLKTVPVGGADTVSITFNTDVNITETDLVLHGLQTATTPALATGGFSYDSTTYTATWEFANNFSADQYLIQLSDNVNANGIALDGEWTNPASVTTVNSGLSTFPSGNGTAGGDFEFVFTILPGDANRDSVVDGIDLSILSGGFNGQGDFTQGDFNGDGNKNALDLSLLGLNFAVDLALLELASDFNGDYSIDALDLSIMGVYWGSTVTPGEDGDANGDGIVDGLDLSVLSSQFGLELDVLS